MSQETDRAGTLTAQRDQDGQATQSAMLWAPDGSGAPALVDPKAVRRTRRDGMRGDARRTAEYLASRGKTPVEALHDLVMLGWKRGYQTLARELGVDKERAFDLWMDCVKSLLPYTAARFETLELGPGAAGGLALGHFLAARAMGDLLATERAPGRSINSTTIDKPVSRELPFSINSLPDAGSGIPDPSRLTIDTLPPKGLD